MLEEGVEVLVYVVEEGELAVVSGDVDALVCRLADEHKPDPRFIEVRGGWWCGWWCGWWRGCSS